ncbi:MAG TPA: NADH-quinone oxidoreductase subunit I [Deltaproteobacteria bacterium]|nr:NADH-quinone oxidoreductase subunit I [Deltaproteobacteria bacterium]
MLVVKRPRLSFWDRIYLGAVFRGMWITIKHAVGNIFHQDRILTYEYPEVKKPIPEQYRAEHRLMQRPDGTPRCTACMLCATACPAHCIEIVAAEHPDPRVEKYPAVYNINLLRCVYCSLCVEACPCDAIRMDTQKLVDAAYTREGFIIDKEHLLKNHPEGKSPYSIALY